MCVGVEKRCASLSFCFGVVGGVTTCQSRSRAVSLRSPLAMVASATRSTDEIMRAHFGPSQGSTQRSFPASFAVSAIIMVRREAPQSVAVSAIMMVQSAVPQGQQQQQHDQQSFVVAVAALQHALALENF